MLSLTWDAPDDEDKWQNLLVGAGKSNVDYSKLTLRGKQATK